MRVLDSTAAVRVTPPGPAAFDHQRDDVPRSEATDILSRFKALEARLGMKLWPLHQVRHCFCTTPTVEVEVPRLELVYLLGVGHLDPLTVDSGLTQRLGNLGYHVSGDDGLSKAIAAFQQDAALPITAEADDETRKALASKHGC